MNFQYKYIHVYSKSQLCSIEYYFAHNLHRQKTDRVTTKYINQSLISCLVSHRDIWRAAVGNFDRVVVDRAQGAGGYRRLFVGRNHFHLV